MAKTITKNPLETLGVDIFLRNNTPFQKAVDVYYGIGKGETYAKWGSFSANLPALQQTKLSGKLILDVTGGTYDLIVKVMDPQTRKYIAVKTFTNVVTVSGPATPVEIVDYLLNNQKSITIDPYGKINVGLKLHNKGTVDRTVDVYYGIGKNGKFEGGAWSILTYKRLPVCQVTSFSAELYPSGVPEGTYDFIVKVMDVERRFVLGEKIFSNVVTVKKVTAPPPAPTPVPTEYKISVVDYLVNGQKQVKVSPFGSVTVKFYVDSNVTESFWAYAYITYNATTSVELSKDLGVIYLRSGRNEITTTFDNLRSLDEGYYGIGIKIGKGSKTYAEKYWGNVILVSVR